MYTLLHISDLHRSAEDPIDNASLISALVADQERHILEGIPRPDAIVVSGDIIQGVPLGHSDYQAELERQYAIAAELLGELCDRWFDGDRKKIVIVPGNHDVCWNTSFLAMEPDRNSSTIAHPKMFGASRLARWDWKARAIYNIERTDQYARRLDPYWRFIDSFYEGVALAIPLQKNQGYNLFELDGGRIIIAAFESTHGNDCFCYQGAIRQGAIGRSSLQVRDLPRPPILKIATWHHSIQGPPGADDYMDVTFVHEMIGQGIRLGLHGHQHRADSSGYTVHLPEELGMVVSSTGSLCAGQRELPSGVNREYNIVRIGDDYASARIYVREMTEGNQFGRCGRGALRSTGFVDMKWALPSAGARQLNAGLRQFDTSTVIAAEEAARGGQLDKALVYLRQLPRPLSDFPRSLLVRTLKQMGNDELLISELGSDARNASELIDLFMAYVNTRDFTNAASLLAAAPSSLLDETTRRSLQEVLDTRSHVWRKAK